MCDDHPRYTDCDCESYDFADCDPGTHAHSRTDCDGNQRTITHTYLPDALSYIAPVTDPNSSPESYTDP